MILVEPVSVSTAGTDKKVRSYVRSSGLVKTIRASEGNEEALVDIQYRRTQSTSEISIRKSASMALEKAALVGAVYQLLLEGRSRVEYFAKHKMKAVDGAPDATRCEYIFQDERLRFLYEGTYPLYTKAGQTVDLYGYNPDNGAPSLEGWDVQYRLADMSENAYFRKNKEYYSRLPHGEGSYWDEVIAPQIELVHQAAEILHWNNKEGFK